MTGGNNRSVRDGLPNPKASGGLNHRMRARI
jgi:hypothetical protein